MTSMIITAFIGNLSYLERCFEILKRKTISVKFN